MSHAARHDINYIALSGDAAIVDGVGSLMSMFAGLIPSGRISVDRERSLLGGAAPFYRCYVCADGREISVGPLEPQFFAALLQMIGAPAPRFSRTPSAIRAAGSGADMLAAWRDPDSP